MARQFLSGIELNNQGRVSNAQDAVSAQDYVTLAQMQALVEGNSWKDSARVASTANVTVSGPGTTIDGITMAAGDRVLLKDQSSQPENGIYIWNSSGGAMTRALDASTFAELEAAVVRVEEGTVNAGTKWAQTQVNGTLGTNNVIWVSDSGSAPAASETQAGVAEIATQTETDTGTDDLRIVTPLKLKSSKLFNRSFPQTIGDGSSTSFNVDHNLNTRDVVVQVYRNSGSYDTVEADTTRPSVNRVTVAFASAPASNAFRVVVQATLN